MEHLGEPTVAVIIVNYGTADLSLAAADSVIYHMHEPSNVELHLVDNASPGDDRATLQNAIELPGRAGKITFWPESENHGFGRGNNVVLSQLALRERPPKYVMLLNPDATLVNDVPAILSEFLDAHPNAAAVGAAICRPDGQKVTAAFNFPSWKTEFVSSAGLAPLTRLLGSPHVSLPPEHPGGSVDWVSGAVVMFRFEVLQKVGFFDPDFFLYFEETELMWRLHKAGYAVHYRPEAMIEHVAGAATGMLNGQHRAKAQPGYWYDSWRLFFVKTRGASGARSVALARLGGSFLHMLRPLIGRKITLSDHFWRDFSRHVLRPLFFGTPDEARPDGRTLKEVWRRSRT